MAESPYEPENSHAPHEMPESRRWTEGPRVSSQPPGWESKLISDLAMSALKEQRRARRWGIFFKLLTFAYITVVGVAFFRADFGDVGASAGTHTAVVDVQGVISAEDDANAYRVVSGLQAAFEDKNTAGIILDINSPGGSPVQAGIIYDEIMRLKSDYPDIPVYAVLGDICASGGYYIAAAADKIYADKASIVGSIGVRMDGFGFTGLMEKIGVERRLLTSGKSKGLLDPFLPENDDEKQHVQSLLNDIHTQFIDVVKRGRGDRLSSDPKMFSGLIWTGQQAVENGLVDQLANASYVAREVIGEERMVSFNPKDPLLDQLSKQLGVSFAHAIKAILPFDSSPFSGAR